MEIEYLQPPQTRAQWKWDGRFPEQHDRDASIALFLWHPVPDGNGLKPGRVLKRISYRPDTRSCMIALAQSLCEQFDAAGHPSQCPDAGVRKEYVKDPLLNSSELMGFERDVEWKVRKSVAMHRNASPGTLSRLAGDENPEIRAKVALNLNTPDGTLKQLQEDPDPSVQTAVKKALYARRVKSQPTTAELSQG